MAATNTVLGLAILAFCTWAVSLAGVASLQAACSPGWGSFLGAGSLNGLTGGLSCHRMFRYQWFIVILEFVLLVALIIAAASRTYNRSRLAWVGLFAVATLLYIQLTDEFMSVRDYGYPFGARNRVRTMLAGALMTAVVNFFLLVAFGFWDEDHLAAHHTHMHGAHGRPTTTVTTEKTATVV